VNEYTVTYRVAPDPTRRLRGAARGSGRASTARIVLHAASAREAIEDLSRRTDLAVAGIVSILETIPSTQKGQSR
jgi:hypothetical protein